MTESPGTWIKQIKLSLLKQCLFRGASVLLSFCVQGSEEKCRVNHWLHKVGTAAHERIYKSCSQRRKTTAQMPAQYCLRWSFCLRWALTRITFGLKTHICCTIIHYYFFEISWAENNNKRGSLIAGLHVQTTSPKRNRLHNGVVEPEEILP